MTATAKTKAPEVKKPKPAEKVGKAIKAAKPAKAKGEAEAPKKEEKPVAPAAAPAQSGFTLEDNVPVPPRAYRGGGGVSPYPFAQMKEEQSFFVSAAIDTSFYVDAAEAKKAQLDEVRRVSNRLVGAARRFARKNPGYTFSVRAVEEERGHGVRVWRIKQEA
jgi:hypothetical protein